VTPYIQITERCNMNCAHCCMSATALGRDMNLETWQLALDLAVDLGSTIVLGGGEPTIHPHFMHILFDSITQATNDYPVWLATNGSKTEISLKLANLARRGVIACALSQDSFHDAIDISVIDAFMDGMQPNRHGGGFMPYEERDLREIRDVSENGVFSVGRAANSDSYMLYSRQDNGTCKCGGPFIKPDGRVQFCSCDDSFQLGHLHRGFHIDNHGIEALGQLLNDHSCWKTLDQEDLILLGEVDCAA